MLKMKHALTFEFDTFPTVREVEDKMIREVAKMPINRKDMAKLLGIGYMTLFRKLRDMKGRKK